MKKASSNQWGNGQYSVSVLGETGEKSMVKEEIKKKKKSLIHNFNQNKLQVNLRYKIKNVTVNRKEGNSGGYLHSQVGEGHSKNAETRKGSVNLTV